MAVSNVTASTISAFSSQQQSALQKSLQDRQDNPLATLQRKATSSSTQLSAFGKVKTSLDDLQARAQALKGFEKSPNLGDLKVAVLGFVQAFNTVNTVVTKTTQKQAVLANDSRSTKVLTEVSRAVAGTRNEVSRATLDKIGITRQKDGTFAVDEKKLEKAFKEDQAETVKTLADIGQRVGQAAEQQLSSKTGVSGKVVDLTDRANELDKLQTDLQQRLETQKKTLQTQAAQLASVSGTSSTATQNALATYVGVSSL